MRCDDLEMDQEATRACLSRPWMFVWDSQSIGHLHRRSTAHAVSNLRGGKLRLLGSSFTGLPTVSRPAKARLRIVQCKQDTNDADRAQEQPSLPRSDIRLYQTWRSPRWMGTPRYSKPVLKTTLRRVKYRPFASIRDATFRFACMGLVLAGLGGLHYSYRRLDRLARDRVQITSAALDTDISIGRIVRCNPVTGVRVKQVAVSKSTLDGVIPYGSASYVDASVSGVLGLLLRRRPLELNVDVENAAITVPNIVSTEYVRTKVQPPKLEEPIGFLAGKWRQSAILQNLPYPHLVGPGKVSFRHSRVRLEGVQRSPVKRSEHVVEVIRMSGRVDLTDRLKQGVPRFNNKNIGKGMLHVKGNFRSGGYFRISASPAWTRDSSRKTTVPSVKAIVSCSRVDIGPIASLISLPFKLHGGNCTGNVELGLFPHVSPIPTMTGDADVRSLGLRFDPAPESPELRNLTGKLSFKERSMTLHTVEGDLESIPLEAKGSIDFKEGFNIVSHARPFDVNRVIETFALKGFIPVEGTVIGKAVVRGMLDEPFVNGWIKAVGSRAKADKVLLKSAEMFYDWDASAGNLTFPSLKAKVVGGGEVTGSGGIYFDMTQSTPYGCWSDQHHSRNPKAQYWNEGADAEKLVPQVPSDEFEVDKWAPFRPYDSMEFQIQGVGIAGSNLLRWYGKEFGMMATEAVGRINGSCLISGHVDDANSRFVWRSSREKSPPKAADTDAGMVPSITDSLRTDLKHRVSAKGLDTKASPSISYSEAAGELPSRKGSTRDSEHGPAKKEDNAEYLGGLISMKLGDLPEARRIKARTILKEFHLKRLLAGDPKLRKILPQIPNVVSSVDTLFKGTVCMRPSWDDTQARSSRSRPSLDLVSIDGALAMRKLTLNDVAFRNVISGSVSLSATDVAISLSESNAQQTTSTDAKLSLDSDDSKPIDMKMTRPKDKLELDVNTRGFLNMCVRWENSELSASTVLDDKKHRIAHLRAKNLDLRQLAGEYNPFYEDEAVQGILSTSAKLDLTDQIGSVKVSVSDLALGPLHFRLARGQFLLKENEIVLQESTIEQRLSKYNIDGKYVVRGDVSDFECLANVNIDRAHIRDLARLFEGGKAIMESAPQEDRTQDSEILRGSQPTVWSPQPRSQFAGGDSFVTYWEVPEDLTFAEKVKWFAESRNRDSETDLSTILDSDPSRGETPLRMYHADNHLSGRISFHYISPKHLGKSKSSSAGKTSESPFRAYENTSLSFNFSGENWILGENSIESLTATGFLEDGSLSIGPFQVRGNNGLLADAECRITSGGSLDGSINLRDAPVSNFSFFQKSGFDAKGNVSGKVGLKGAISNPTAYGQVLWQNATVNGRHVSQPHADLACSNGRCAINIDAEVGGKNRQRRMDNAEARQFVPSDRITAALDEIESKKVNAPMKRISEKRPKGVDYVRARVSIPVKLFVHQYVFPRIPLGMLQDTLDAFDNQAPFDDDWIYASIDIKRYGMVLLNAVLPKMGWIGGESDILVEVSGTQKYPEVEGTVRFKDGSMNPSWITHPIHALKGEVELNGGGFISCTSLSGRCNGRGLSLRGGLFLSKTFEQRLEGKVQQMRELISMSDSVKRKRKRSPSLNSPLEEAASNLLKGREGFRIETGGIPIDIENVCSGNVSGKFLLTGNVMRPEVDGSVLFSDGVIRASSALTDATQSTRMKTNRASRLPAHAHNTQEAAKQIDTTSARSEKVKKVRGSSPDDDENERFGVHLKQLRVNLGRNVRVTHSFLFNVLVAGNTSFRGSVTNPSFTGKINILSGNVSALPTRWAIRKAEKSYVRFAHDVGVTDEHPEPIIKLALENDAIILRVSECAASSWMEHLSLSDKSGNQMSEGWWADAIHESADEKNGNRLKIISLLTSLMINTLRVGGEIGKYDWKVFPTYFSAALPRLSSSLDGKYGAGFQLGEENFCVESNMFVDKKKGGQIMIRIAKILSVHLFGDQTRRFVKFELTLPGKR